MSRIFILLFLLLPSCATFQRPGADISICTTSCAPYPVVMFSPGDDRCWCGPPPTTPSPTP